MCTNNISFVTKVWLSCHLHDKSKEGEYEDDPGQHGGCRDEVDVVLVAPWPRPPESGPHRPQLMVARAHPGQGVGFGLLVHPSLPGEENMFFNEQKLFSIFNLF